MAPPTEPRRRFATVKKVNKAGEHASPRLAMWHHPTCQIQEGEIVRLPYLAFTKQVGVWRFPVQFASKPEAAGALKMKPEGDRIAELSSEAKAWTRNTTGQPAGNMGTQYAYKEDPQQKLSKAARCSPPFDGLTFTDAAAVAAVAGSLHLVASTLSREKPSDALVIDSRLREGEEVFATSSRCRQFLAHESIFPPRLHGALITPIDAIESKSAGAGRDPFVIKIAPRQRVSFRTLQRRRWQTDGRTAFGS